MRPTCESVNRHWISLVKPKREGSFKLPTRCDLSLVTGSFFHLSSFGLFMQETIT